MMQVKGASLQTSSSRVVDHYWANWNSVLTRIKKAMPLRFQSLGLPGVHSNCCLVATSVNGLLKASEAIVSSMELW